MKRFFSILFVLVVFGAGAQSKKVWLYYADQFYQKGDYASALDYYNKILDDSTILKTSWILPYEASIGNQKLENKEVNADSTRKVKLKDYVEHQVAMCYKYTFDYPHAVTQFKKTADKGSYPDDKFMYAEALMNMKRYAEAVEGFENYLTSEKKNDSLAKAAQRHMTGCFYAMDSNNVKTNYVVTFGDTAIFNKGTASFAPMWWGSFNKLIFTSARTGGILIDPEKQQSEYLCDLYWVESEGDSAWGKVHNFGRPVNSAQHDASGAFTIDDVLYFTRWNDLNPNERNMYMARMMNGKWFEALKLDTAVNIPGCKAINPFVSMDGTTLYFSSNRPGGSGGMDIWSIQIDERGNPISKAKNLGKAINTPYDEVTPFFHTVSSTLYFSSNGHATMGGLDIFKSTFDIDAEAYGDPVNMGMPINSSKDDAYLIWDRFMKKGYFSSDREECESGHCYDIYVVNNGKIEIKLEGTVYDQETEEPIPNSLVTFKDVKGEAEPFFITTDEKGYYNTELTQEQELFLKAQKVKYFADAAALNTNGITESTTLVQDFFLKPQPAEGVEIEIEGIEYDFNKATLRPKSMAVLDKLFDFLQLNDNLSVEIKAHTDCRGSDASNMDLSQRRAKSCVDYLVQKGIAVSRLHPQGYGETQPIPGHECDVIEKLKNTDKAKFEQLHQENRRTAFRVTKEGSLDPVLKSKGE